MEGPVIERDLAETINRLGSIRRQLKDLETEEALLRNQVVAALAGWPAKWFPIRVGGYEIRRQQRAGKLDVDQAVKILLDKGLLALLESTPVIIGTQEVYALRVDLASQMMPPETRSVLLQDYEAAIGERPVIAVGDIEALHQQGKLTEDEWKGCFKDAKPFIEMLTVR